MHLVDAAEEESHKLFILITAEVGQYLQVLLRFVPQAEELIEELHKKGEKKLSDEEYKKLKKLLENRIAILMKELDEEIRREYKRLLEIADAATKMEGTTFMGIEQKFHIDSVKMMELLILKQI